MAIFSNFGLENIIYISIGLSLLFIILLIWNIRLEIRMRRLLRGKSAKSLEGSFVNMQRELADFNDFQKEMEKYLAGVENRLSSSLRGFHNINFSAFKGMDSGGKSHATAFLNEKGDGIILSSLHARDRISTFAKQIKNYKTNIELSEEEQAALTKAKESCKV